MSTFNNFVYSVRQKDQLNLGVAFELMQKFDLILNHRFHFVCQLFTLVVVVVPFKVEDVFLQLKLCGFSGFVLLAYFLIIKSVAFIISSSTLIVLLPFSKTNPTKLGVAHLALHMIASLIFLNWFPTFGIRALLCVCDNPVYIFWFARVLKRPCFVHFTSCRRMWFFSALKAIRFATKAIDNILIGIVQFICSVIAILKRTPFDHVVVIGVGLTVVPLVSFQNSGAAF